jgi:hypothetical protein
MWDDLRFQLFNGKTGWGKRELLRLMDEIEITWKEENSLIAVEREISRAGVDINDYSAVREYLKNKKYSTKVLDASNFGLSDADYIDIEKSLDKAQGIS